LSYWPKQGRDKAIKPNPNPIITYFVSR